MDFLLEDAEKPYGIRHRCFFFAKSIIVFVKACKYDYVFRSLFDQLIRSAASVGANVVEGRAGSSKRLVEISDDCIEIVERGEILAMSDKRYLGC